MRARGARSSFCPSPEEQIKEPVGDRNQSLEIGMTRICIIVRSAIPVIAGEQVVGEDAHVAERLTQALTPRWIAGAGRVAEQRNTGAIRMIHPALGHIETRERPDGPRARVGLGGIPVLRHSSTKRAASPSPCRRGKSVSYIR